MAKELVLTVVVRKEGTGYSSWCPELDVASQGDTIEEARGNLKEAVELHIEAMLADGLLDELLEKMGLTKDDVKKKHILLPDSFSGSFEVPIAV